MADEGTPPSSCLPCRRLLSRDQQLISLNAQRKSEALDIVYGDIPNLAFYMCDKGPMESTLKRESLLRPTLGLPKKKHICSKHSPSAGPFTRIF